MNGFCRTLSCFYGAQFDPSEGDWAAIKVYLDGNPIEIARGFATEEEAEQAASDERERDLSDNGQFGVGT